ncbi:MAG: FlgD immunoglobulin-like domain containing protein [Candidatus Syntrophosphaera sp.]
MDIYPSEDWETPPYNWTINNDGIVGVTGSTGDYGYLQTSQSMGEWFPDPSSGLWYNIMGDEAGDENTTTPWLTTDQPILTIDPTPNGGSFTYLYALSSLDDPYKYSRHEQVAFSGGYWGDFWMSPYTSWYAGDINGGYLISTAEAGPFPTAPAYGYLLFSVLKLPGGGGSAYLYIDYSTEGPDGPWILGGTSHNISHNTRDWVNYMAPIDGVPGGSYAWLRLRFRASVTTSNAPFYPQPNMWMDDFRITDEHPTPVELSTFTAVLTQQYFVNLTWVTQSETGVNGFYIFRGTSEDLATAEIVSPMIPATNTSQPQTYVFTDTELYDSGTYYYWLQNVDYDGTVYFHGPVSINYSNSQDNPAPPVPNLTELQAIYPNPFNPTAFIPFSLANDTDVSLQIYNTRGQMIRHFDLGTKEAGQHRVTWDGRDANGNILSNGVYYIRMIAGQSSFQRKALLLK